MTGLKQLNLTDKDFQLLIDTLDYLPEKGSTGELMADLFVNILGPNKNAQDYAAREIEKLKKKRALEKAILSEDVKMLQAKLITFKRYLQENNLLKTAEDLINP